MKRFFALGTALSLAAVLALHADTPDELFVRYYQMIQQGETLLAAGQEKAGYEQLYLAQEGLKGLKSSYPTWNDKIVSYRLDYLAQKIAPLAAKYPAPKPAEAPKPEVKSAEPGMDTQISRLNDEIIQLRTERALIQKQLNEALSARPAAVDPKEMARSQEQVQHLQKENDTLKVTLDQEQKRAARLVEPTAVELAKKEAAESAKDAEKARKESESLQKKVQTLTDKGEMTRIKEENSGLKKQVSDMNKQVASVGKVESNLKKLEMEKASLQLENDNLKQNLQAEKANASKLGQMAKLEESNRALQEKTAVLQRENDTLKQNLRVEQAKAGKMTDSAVVDQLRKELSDTNRKLTEQTTAAAKVEDLSKQLALARAELQQQRSTIEALQKDNRKMEALLTDPNFGAPSNAKGAQQQMDEARKANESRMTDLNKQMAALEKRNRDLESQLKDAANSARSNPKDAARIKELEQERTDLDKQLRSTRDDLGTAQKAEARLTSLLKEKEDLLKQNRDLAAQLKAAMAAGGKSNPKDIARIKELEQTRDDIEKQLKSATKELNDRKARNDSAKVHELADQLATLRATIETLEARKVPYTKAELALFNKQPASAPAPSVTKVAANEARPTANPGVPTKTLVAEAQTAFAARRYEEADQKFTQAIKQDGDNVATLSNLAAVQIEQGRLEDAEANLKKALALAPNDGHSLFQYGYLKYRQVKLDDALGYLSKAAEVEPKNADIQNYLGIVLSEKGQRGAAEAALRKAIQIAPGNGGAHHNLAVIYATQTPPLLELARWHYEKALAAGHPKNAELEKLLK